MNIDELERESAELLPDRQALCCWNYSWHYDHGVSRWTAGQGNYGYGYDNGLRLDLDLQL